MRASTLFLAAGLAGVVACRSGISTIAATGDAIDMTADTGSVRAAAPDAESAVAAGVVPGVEVLLADSLHLLRGKRVGLITNHTGRDRKGTSTVDLLHKAPGVQLTALYGPEHGLRGVAKAGEHIASTVDSATGVPIFSLFGETLVPNAEMLSNVDVLVYD